MPQKPCLFHIKKDVHHAVVAQLRVLICPADEGGYVAQGLEIDYCAAGATVEEVQERFAKGLLRTAESYVKRGRSLSGMMAAKTPADVWDEYLALQANDQHELTCATFVEYDPASLPAGMPFTSLAFCEAPRHAA